MAITRHPKTQTPPPEDAVLLKRVRILYVEDEDLNWEVTLLHLKSRYDVERARNSKEAFALYKAHTFHAILMDIQLHDSDLDGIGITQVLRGTYTKKAPDYAQGIPRTDVPIIFMTAYSARYRASDLPQMGGDELITKPIDFTHLGLCLSRCLIKGILPKAVVSSPKA